MATEGWVNGINLWDSLLFETDCHRSRTQAGLQHRSSGAVQCLPLERAEAAAAAEEFGVCPVFLLHVSSLRQRCYCGCNGSSHSTYPQGTKDYLKPFTSELLHFTTELYLVFIFTLSAFGGCMCVIWFQRSYIGTKLVHLLGELGLSQYSCRNKSWKGQGLMVFSGLGCSLDLHEKDQS